MLLPKLKAFLDQVNVLAEHRKKSGFKVNQTNIRESLAFIAFSYMKESDQSILAIDDTILNDKYPIPIRIYMPPQAQNLPVMVYIHGGGHTCGSITVYDKVVRKTTRLTKHIIVSIDYRLSPEFAYPTALNDCKTVIKSIFNVLDGWKINYKDKNLSIMGDSAGGALTTSIVMDKDFTLQHNIKKQVLIYPSVDYTASSESYKKYDTGYLLEIQRMEWYFNNYLQNNEDKKSVSTLFCDFYPEMPETMVVVAEYDPLHDEGILYAEKVQETGVKSEFHDVKGVIHAFFLMEDLCMDACNDAYQKISNFLNS